MDNAVDILNNCVQHTLQGRVWQCDSETVLVLDNTMPKGRVLASPPVTLRYAIPMLGPAHLAVIPAVFVSERGLLLYGEQAWRFVVENYQLYPRAEVFGLNTEGENVQIFLRELDFGAEYRVYAYADPQEQLPLEQVHRLIGYESVEVPELVLQLLSI